MLTFNVWPSQVSDLIKLEICNAVKNDIISISHRGSEFTRISKEAIEGLREFYKIPSSYKIFYTSSATKSMKLSIRNCCMKKSFHFINWNFSKLFSKISSSLWKDIEVNDVEWWKSNDYKNSKIPDDVDLISITHNETSTWASCTNEDIEYIRKVHLEKILVVDITSSAWVYDFDINQADIWAFSVQKCFWLPSGLWIMIVSDKAFRKSLDLSSRWFNTSWIISFEDMNKKMENKYQTIFTPNVLNIYLLSRVLNHFNKNWWVENNKNKALEKYSYLEDFVNSRDDFDFFVVDKLSRSLSVICLKLDNDLIKKIKEKCKTLNIEVWSWYWVLKESTIRIANFPAISMGDFKKLVWVFTHL